MDDRSTTDLLWVLGEVVGDLGETESSKDGCRRLALDEECERGAYKLVQSYVIATELDRSFLRHGHDVTCRGAAHSHLDLEGAVELLIDGYASLSHRAPRYV